MLTRKVQVAQVGTSRQGKSIKEVRVIPPSQSPCRGSLLNFIHHERICLEANAVDCGICSGPANPCSLSGRREDKRDPQLPIVVGSGDGPR